MNITDTEIDVVYVALINFRNHLQKLAFPFEMDSATKAELEVTNKLLDKIVRKVFTNEPT